VDFREIYEHHAGEYDELVAAEDVHDRLLPALLMITPLDGKHVLEVGSGTGRITRLLRRAGARVRGFERAPAMLAVAEKHLAGDPGCELSLADAQQLPVADGWADAAVAGWVFGHFRSWMPENWRASVGRALGEMQRSLRAGGTMIIIETLGTGNTLPSPPSPELAEYFAWLEDQHQFTRTSIRTDYQFETPQRALELMTFFFGQEMGERVRHFGANIPECTGLWWRKY
jgi:ubiquinone/menaquinone biosynthesis C-methylase UbiE